MVRRDKLILLAMIAIPALLVGSIVLRYHIYYPYGSRAAKLSTFWLKLKEYADDHNGWYPKDKSTALQCLQQLHPKYTISGKELAGLTGSERETKRLLDLGQPLDERASSWVYWPGFRQDDSPDLAIMWERKDGVFFTGARASGHAVAFAAGGYAQIPEDEWDAFVKKQELLRREILAGRN